MARDLQGKTTTNLNQQKRILWHLFASSSLFLFSFHHFYIIPWLKSFCLQDTNTFDILADISVSPWNNVSSTIPVESSPFLCIHLFIHLVFKSKFLEFLAQYFCNIYYEFYIISITMTIVVGWLVGWLWQMEWNWRRNRPSVSSPSELAMIWRVAYVGAAAMRVKTSPNSWTKSNVPMWWCWIDGASRYSTLIRPFVNNCQRDG